MITYILYGIAILLVAYRLRAYLTVIKKFNLSAGEQKEKTEQELIKEKSYLSYVAMFSIVIIAFPVQVGALIVETPKLAMIFGLIVWVHTFFPDYMRSIRRIQKITWVIGAIIIVWRIIIPAAETFVPATTLYSWLSSAPTARRPSTVARRPPVPRVIPKDIEVPLTPGKWTKPVVLKNILPAGIWFDFQGYIPPGTLVKRVADGPDGPEVSITQNLGWDKKNLRGLTFYAPKNSPSDSVLRITFRRG